MFTFTPLLGAQPSSSKASQSILELEGGIKILVDVGWDDSFDALDLVALEKYAAPSWPIHGNELLTLQLRTGTFRRYL